MRLALVFLLGALTGVIGSVRYDGAGVGWGEHEYVYRDFRWRGLRIHLCIGDGAKE